MRGYGKKGAYVWLSWVLLMGFMVALSALMYNWIFGYTQTSVESLERRAFDATECDDIGISLDDICQDPLTLQVKIKNRKERDVDKIIFRLYNIYDEPLPIKEKRINIKPDKTETTTVLKQGVVKTIEAIPVSFVKKTEVICRNRIVRIEDADDMVARC